MLAGVTDCRWSWKWGCRRRLALAFKPRCGSLKDRGPHGFGGEERRREERGPPAFGVLLVATWLRQQERLCWEGKGKKCCNPNASRKSNGDVWSALRWCFIFYLRRGELPGCRLRLQRGVAPNAHRLALLYAREASKQASYESGGCRYLCIALGSGGTLTRC